MIPRQFKLSYRIIKSILSSFLSVLVHFPISYDYVLRLQQNWLICKFIRFTIVKNKDRFEYIIFNIHHIQKVFDERRKTEYFFLHYTRTDTLTSFACTSFTFIRDMEEKKSFWFSISRARVCVWTGQ